MAQQTRCLTRLKMKGWIYWPASLTMAPMQTILIILLIAAMGATVFFLIRGVVAFIKTTEADLMGEGPNQSGFRQNKAMQGRIIMQAVAVGIVLLLLLLLGR